MVKNPAKMIQLFQKNLKNMRHQNQIYSPARRQREKFDMIPILQEIGHTVSFVSLQFTLEHNAQVSGNSQHVSVNIHIESKYPLRGSI